MVGRWRIAVGAAVVSALVLSACSGDDDEEMQFDGRELSNGQTVLNKVEKRWSQDLDGYRVNKTKQSRCYLTQTDGSTVVDKYAYCGPAKYAADDDVKADDDVDVDLEGEDDSDEVGPGVWDRYRLKGSTNEDSVSLRLSDSASVERGLNVKPNVKFVRPDGKKPPKNAEDIGLPPAPPMESRNSTVVDSVDIKDSVEPQDGRLITPTQTLTVERVGTVPQVDTSKGARGSAKGERLVAVEVSFSDGPYSDKYDEPIAGNDKKVDADTEYAIQIGGDRQKVDFTQASEFDELPDSATVVVSVPTAVRDPQLVATSAGKDQAISLRNGERTEEAPGLYRETELGVTKQYPTGRYKEGDFSLNYSATFTAAHLTPFDPMLGWAPDGKSWLALEMEDMSGDWTSQYTTRVDQEKTATARDANGTVFKDTAEAEADPFIANDLIAPPTFEVDESSRSFEVTFQPTVMYTAVGDLRKPSSGTAKLKPMTFKLNFPEK